MQILEDTNTQVRKKISILQNPDYVNQGRAPNKFYGIDLNTNYYFYQDFKLAYGKDTTFVISHLNNAQLAINIIKETNEKWSKLSE